MKFTINSRIFREALETVQGALETKATIPILKSFLLAAKDGHLSITGTDLDVTLQTECEAEVTGEGTFAVDGRRLSEIVKLASSDEITVTLKDAKLTLASGTARSAVLGDGPENFPSTSTLPTTEPVRIEARALRGLLGSVIHAVTQEASRYAMQGVLLSQKRDELISVGTDGHRVAIASKPIVSGLDADLLIPFKAVRLLIPFCDKDGDVELFLDNNHYFYFRLGRSILTTRKLVGQFPNYELAIPTHNTISIPFHVNGAINALRRAFVFTDKRTRGIELNFSKNKLSLIARDADKGEHREELNIANDVDLRIGVSVDYLSDALKAAGEEVAIKLKDEYTPILIESDGHKEIICPWRLS